MTEAQWFALMVYTGREKWTAAKLDTWGFSQILLVCREVRQWSDRQQTIEAPVFPGYIFCKFSLQETPRVLSVPGVFGIVGVGPKAVAIDEQEIAALQTLHKTDAKIERWPYLREGDLVRIQGGALDGLEGRFVSQKKGQRLILSVSLLQRSLAVELDDCRVIPAGPGPAACSASSRANAARA